MVQFSCCHSARLRVSSNCACTWSEAANLDAWKDFFVHVVFDRELSAYSCAEKKNKMDWNDLQKSQVIGSWQHHDFLFYYNPTFFWFSPVLEGQNNMFGHPGDTTSILCRFACPSSCFHPLAYHHVKGLPLWKTFSWKGINMPSTPFSIRMFATSHCVPWISVHVAGLWPN